MEMESESSEEPRRFDTKWSVSADSSQPLYAGKRIGSDAKTRREHLSEIITDQIFPRLHILHHGLRNSLAPSIPVDDIAEFGDIVTRAEFRPSVAYFESMMATGHSRDTLFLRLLQPTARYLAKLCEQDELDSFDVTIGIAHLRALLSIFGSYDDVPLRDTDHRALLVACPREKQLFDLDVISKFMRGAGWDTNYQPGLSVADCCSAAAKEWFGVLDLTLSSNVDASTAAYMIEKIRRKSANRSISVLVGGLAFENDPDLVVRVGADATALDAPMAVVLAEKLLLSATVTYDKICIPTLACA